MRVPLFASAYSPHPRAWEFSSLLAPVLSFHGSRVLFSRLFRHRVQLGNIRNGRLGAGSSKVLHQSIDRSRCVSISHWTGKDGGQKSGWWGSMYALGVINTCIRISSSSPSKVWFCEHMALFPMGRFSFAGMPEAPRRAREWHAGRDRDGL